MSDIERRKREHMELARSDAAASTRAAGWDDVELRPVAVPDVSIADVDVSTTFLGRRLAAPILIAGMTGGHEQALGINRSLARAAAGLGLAVGVGSQRAALVDPTLAPTYAVVRDEAPDAVVIANIGMCQLVEQDGRPPLGPDDIRIAVEMIDADFLAVHLNAVEELIQPEGDRNMTGLGAAIARAVEWSPVPVIAKETGAGLTREAAIDLAGWGVHALDVGGVGGTSFARVEALRAANVGDRRGIRLGETFGGWGVPTVASIVEAGLAGLPLVATGGVRNGLHVAKALALGATIVGVGGPVINAARHGPEAVVEELTLLVEELKVAMVLTDTSAVADLGKSESIVTGRTAEWLRARGLIDD